MNEREISFRSTLANLETAVQAYACPIYGVRGRTGKPIGSGFLLDVAGRTLLVTAAHVLHERHSCTLQIPGKSRIVPFGGDFYSTGPHEPDPNPEFGLDIGLVDLDIPGMLEPPKCPSFSVRDLDPSDLPSDQTAYGFVGFPASVNQPRPGYEIQVSSYYYGGQPSNRPKYEILGYHPNSQFLMMFDHERMIDHQAREVQVPEPSGMSGGPVFRLGSFAEIEAGVARPHVIGITIEWAKYLKVLIAARVSLVLDAMRQLMPQLQSHIEPAKHVRTFVELEPKRNL